MNIITVDKSNIGSEHICCAISNDNDCQVASKKKWLTERFDDGLVFKKGDVRGKCFIEYIPAEKCWCPINADGYTFIDCLWVSGQFKGQGNSNLLFDECVADCKSKGSKGLVIVSSAKKMPFLSDSSYLKHKGFILCDTAEPFYELYYLPFSDNAEKPCFKPNAKNPHIEKSGYVLYYTAQCPYTAKYVPIIEQVAKKKGVEFEAIRLENATQAQNAPAPFTTYTMFFNGKFLLSEILSDKKFEKIIDENNK